MKYITHKKYNIVNKSTEIILYLLVDRPNIIINSGFWWMNDEHEWHRNYNLPAHTSLLPNEINKSYHLDWYLNDNLIKQII